MPCLTSDNATNGLVRRCNSSYQHAVLDRQLFEHYVCRKACRPKILLLLSLVTDLHTTGSRLCPALLSIPTGMAGALSDARCHRGWQRPIVHIHWWTVCRCIARGQRLHRSLSTAAEPLPSESWFGAGRLSYNRSCDLRSLSIWRLVH